MENKPLNILMSGKLGDFTHSLFAVHKICLTQNLKANLYMIDLGWDFGIKNTYQEYKPIIEAQSYINSFNILEGYNLDPIQTPKQSTPIEIFDKEFKYIDLMGYIRSPLLYKACWSEIYSNLFNFKIDKKTFKTIEFNEVDPKFENKIILHRRTTSLERLSTKFPYEEILAIYKNDCIFVSTSEKDYNLFPYKDGLEFYKINTLTDWYKTINSGNLFITNLSGPEAIASVLDVPRLIELPNLPDANHFFGEANYSDNMFFYLDEKINNCQNIFQYK
jgi:hypothetical protein